MPKASFTSEKVGMYIEDGVYVPTVGRSPSATQETSAGDPYNAAWQCSLVDLFADAP